MLVRRPFRLVDHWLKYVFSPTDGITFLTIVAGIIRAGYTAFPISTRNSPAAVAHLLKSTGCKNLFVSADPAMQELARMQDGINTIPMPTFEDLYLKNDSEPLSHVRPDWEQLALIVYSSGSTRFPRPIPYTHRFYTMHSIILCVPFPSFTQSRDLIYGAIGLVTATFV